MYLFNVKKLNDAHSTYYLITMETFKQYLDIINFGEGHFSYNNIIY